MLHFLTRTNTTAELDRHVDRCDNFRQHLAIARLAALERASGPSTPAELVPAAYPDVKPDLYPFAERSLLAHLQKLAREGRATETGGRFGAGRAASTRR